MNMTEKDLLRKGYIPLDKSWIIRMGVLDLVNGYDDTINFLYERYEELGDDLKALYHASLQWKKGVVDVGESGTLYRFLKFASWKLGKDVEFILRGSLKHRKICDDPSIINWSLRDLLTLDNGTSQWASASVLMGNPERISNPPFKLRLTFNAVEHWKNRRQKNKRWKEKHDRTILNQALAYSEWLKKGRMDFKPEQAEDYCFSRAFGLITPEEGKKLWPSLEGHESDRIKEMEKALRQEKITSKDHRVVQAIVMLKGNKIRVKYPESVKKTWPQFWNFVEDFSE